MSFTAMVLAAGLGTRLRPLTDELPKPLCPVGGRAPASRVVELLARAGASHVVVNVHHLADAWSGWAEAQPLPVVVVREGGDAPLGTAGGIANARSHLGAGDVVIWNGDVIAEVDVAALLAAHRARAAHATLAVRPRAAAQGAVGLSGDGRVVRLRASCAAAENEGGDYAGIAVLSPACVASLPAEGCLVGDAWIPHLLGGGTPILAVPYRGVFRDIGSLAEYLDANIDAARAAGGAIVCQRARVDGAITVEDAVVGDGARVIGAGPLRRVVVWPGATATAPLEDAVVTRLGTIAVGR